MALNKFKAVKGQLPKKIDISDWSQEKMLSLLIFGSLSLREVVRHGKKEFSFHYDKQFEEIVAQYDNPFFQEFMTRLSVPGASYLSLRGRLIVMIRTMLAYIKSNPHVINEKMEHLMKTTERFSWALANFEVKELAMGAEVVTVNNQETTDIDRKNAAPDRTGLTLPEVHYQRSLLAFSGLLASLLKGIKQSDIKEMDVKDKLKLAIPMIQTLGKAFTNSKPKSLVFKNLTINSAGKDDLEKAILTYSKEQL